MGGFGFQKKQKPAKDNIEINYEELAEAIAKAEKKVQEEENAIDGAAETLKGILVTFLGVAIAFFVLLLIGCVQHIVTKSGNAFNNTCLAIVSAVYIFALIGFLTDIKKISDKGYLVGVFSALVSLSALAVSVVGLFRG